MSLTIVGNTSMNGPMSISAPPEPTVWSGTSLAFGLPELGGYGPGRGTLSPTTLEGNLISSLLTQNAGSPQDLKLTLDGSHPQNFFTSMTVIRDSDDFVMGTVNSADVSSFFNGSNTIWTWNPKPFTFANNVVYNITFTPSSLGA